MQTPDLTTYLILHRGMRTDAARLATAVSGVTEADRSLRGPALSRWYAGPVLPAGAAAAERAAA